MEQFEFDLESLYGALITNPFTVDGSFGCDMVELEDDGITIQLDGDDYNIIEIVAELPDDGIVTVLTSDDDRLSINFFKPANFNDLNVS